jgi:GNAT superfamily N-acetyltransferase
MVNAAGSVIRAATKADAHAIADVQVASWRAGYAHVFPDSVLYADDFESSRQAFWTSWRFAPGHRVAVATIAHDGEASVVGFCSYGPERERARGFTGRGEIWAFYLHPDAWGTGAADALMEAAEDRLVRDGFPDAVLWVLDDNPRARAFYQKHGWEPSGRETLFDRYCEAHAPEVEYRKTLQ